MMIDLRADEHVGQDLLLQYAAHKAPVLIAGATELMP